MSQTSEMIATIEHGLGLDTSTEFERYLACLDLAIVTKGFNLVCINEDTGLRRRLTTIGLQDQYLARYREWDE